MIKNRPLPLSIFFRYLCPVQSSVPNSSSCQLLSLSSSSHISAHSPLSRITSLALLSISPLMGVCSSPDAFTSAQCNRWAMRDWDCYKNPSSVLQLICRRAHTHTRTLLKLIFGTNTYNNFTKLVMHTTHRQMFCQNTHTEIGCLYIQIISFCPPFVYM